MTSNCGFPHHVAAITPSLADGHTIRYNIVQHAAGSKLRSGLRNAITPL
jgi:hypothetical protein